LLKRKTKREGEGDGERGTADKQSQAPKKSGGGLVAGEVGGGGA